MWVLLCDRPNRSVQNPHREEKKAEFHETTLVLEVSFDTSPS